MDLLEKHVVELHSSSLPIILKSKNLAQLGDFLANFIYSSARMQLGHSGSVHVWDYSLRVAMDPAGLREQMSKRTKPDRVSDAAEALIAFAYFKKLLRVDEMITFLTHELNEINFNKRSGEKEECARVFSLLLSKIVSLGYEKNYFS